MAEDNGFWHVLAQMFTPPKGKSPWTAMTTGGTYKNAELERWGPAINQTGKIVGNAIFPGAGDIGAAIGGGIGMQGRGTGFQGTDAGWGNVMPTVTGAYSGYKGNILSALQNSGGQRPNFMGITGQGYNVGGQELDLSAMTGKAPTSNTWLAPQQDEAELKRKREAKQIEELLKIAMANQNRQQYQSPYNPQQPVFSMAPIYGR